MSLDKMPPAVVRLKVEPQTRADQDNLIISLRLLTSGTSTWSFSIDRESREIILGGQCEMDLDRLIGAVMARGVAVNVGAPQVAYRETIAKTAEIDFRLSKPTAAADLHFRVKLRLEPNGMDNGNAFVVDLQGAPLPRECIEGIERGVRSIWDTGVLIGFPIVDTKVTLLDGEHRDGSSLPAAFEAAARQAMKEACDKGGIAILEPIMDVEVVTPGDFVGGIIGDINSRRGRIRAQEMRGGKTVIRAHIPLSNMFGYFSQLSALSRAQADYRMAFDHYALVPRNVAPDGPDNFPPALGMRA